MRNLEKIFSFDFIIFLLLLVLISAFSLNPVRDPDIWYHLKIGEYIVANHEIPKYDPFSYTSPHKPWLVYSWLFEIGTYISYKNFGWLGILLMKLFILQLAFWFLFLTLRKQTSNLLLAVIVTVFAVLSSVLAFTPRPWIFSFAFTSLTIYILEDYRNGNSSKLKWLPLIAVFWVNIHILFPIIFILISFVLVEKIVQLYLSNKHNKIKEIYPLALAGVGTVIGFFINPYTWRIFPLFITISQEKWVYQNVSEMQSPNFHEPFILLFGVFILVSILSLICIPKKLKIYEILIFCFFAFLSLDRTRNIPLFAISMSPLVIVGMNHLFSRINSLVHNRNYISTNTNKQAFKIIPLNILLIILLIATFFWILVPGQKRYNYPYFKDLPMAATNFLLSKKPTGNLFNDFDSGGFLIFNLYPQYKVFIDGRTTVHGEKVLNEYYYIYSLEPNWQELLEKYEIKTILTSPKSALGQALRITPGWHLIYEDNISVIYRRM